MVELNQNELMELSKFGINRVINVIELKLKDPAKKEAHLIWSYHIEGALREGALIKYMTGSALTHPLHDKFKSLPDTPFGNVRGTHVPFGKLIIRPSEINDVDPLWFVVGMRGKYRVIGSVIPQQFLNGDRQKKYWNADCNEPSWWIPQADIPLEFAEGAMADA